MKMGKKYSDSIKLIDKARLYDPAEAIDLVCQTSKANETKSLCGIVESVLFNKLYAICIFLSHFYLPPISLQLQRP